MYNNDNNLIFTNHWNDIKNNFINKIENNLLNYRLFSYENSDLDSLNNGDLDRQGEDSTDVKMESEDEAEKLLNYKLIKLNSYEYMKYYTMIYEICVNKDTKNTERLYNNLCNNIKAFLANQILTQLKGDEKMDETEEEKLVLRINEHWIKYNNYVKILNGIFSYLNRYYIQITLKPNIYYYSLAIFQKLVFEPFKERIRKYLLKLLRLKRSGNEISNLHVLVIMDMYNKLDSTNGLQYKEDLEPYILQDCNDYYSKISTIWLNDLSLVDYIYIIDYVINEEMSYYSKNINKDINKLLYKIIVNNLLFNNEEQILAKFKSEFNELLDSYKLNEIKLIYKYIKVLNGINEYVTNLLQSFIYNKIDSYSNTGDVEKEEIVIKLYNKYLHLIEYCFNTTDSSIDNDTARVDFNESEPVYLNLDYNSLANSTILLSYNNMFNRHTSNSFIEFINKKFDSILTTHASLTSTSNFPDNDDLNSLVKYYKNVLINYNTHFVNHYKSNLFKRIIFNKIHLQNELSLAQQLFQHSTNSPCSDVGGTNIGTGVMNILNDLKKSNLNFNRYTTSLQDKDSKLSNISIVSESILQTMNLTLTRSINTVNRNSTFNIKLDPVFLKESEDFKIFYLSQNKYKRFDYLFDYCLVELDYVTPKGVVLNVVCNIFQATLLLLFNSNWRMKLDQVAEKLETKRDQVTKLVKSCDKLLSFDGDYIVLNVVDDTHINLVDFQTKTKGSVNHEGRVIENPVLYDYNYIDCLIIKMIKQYQSIERTSILQILLNDHIIKARKHDNEQVLDGRIDNLISKEYISQVDNTLTYMP